MLWVKAQEIAGLRKINDWLCEAVKPVKQKNLIWRLSPALRPNALCFLNESACDVPVPFMDSLII